MNLSELAARRYTTKHYDPAKEISPALLAQLWDLLRLAPSSVNSQPWHFVVAGTAEGKAKILPAILDFNHARVTDAAQVVVLCARAPLTEEHLRRVLAREEKDGRFETAELKAAGDAGRHHFVGLNSATPEAQFAWAGKQVYLALGQLLLGAAALGIDSTPIEGFDAEKMDALLGLRERGFRSVVVASLGYRSENDGNATRPKSRLSAEEIFTFI